MISCGSRLRDLRGAWLRLPVLLVLALLLAACGRETSLLQENAKDYIYRFQDIPTSLPAGSGRSGSNLSALFWSGGRICAAFDVYDQRGSVTCLLTSDAEGREVRTVSMGDAGEAEEGSSVTFGRFCSCQDALYALRSTSRFDEETGMDVGQREILELSQEGEVLGAHPLEAPETEEGDWYVDEMDALEAGRLLIKASTGLYLYETAEDRLRLILASPTPGYYEATVTVLADGAVLVGSWGKEGYELRELDLETGTLSECLGIPFTAYGCALYPGSSHDVYFFANRVLWYYDRAGDRSGKVMDPMASELLLDDVNGLAELPDGRFALSGVLWSEEAGAPLLKLCTHVPPEEVREREEITVSCVYADAALIRRAVAFNQENEEYRVRVADYAQYSSDEDWTAPYRKLNEDIVTGNIPDILLLDEELPVESYVSKGLLRDLSGFLEEDEALSAEPFMTNVFDAYREGGALYQLVPSFMVYTGAALKETIGDRMSLTMRELSDLCEARGLPQTGCFGDTTRDSLLSMLMYVQGSEFIDLESGRCDFDSEGFIDLLELVGQFPAEQKDSDYMERQKAYREGRALVMLTGLGGFSDYATMRYGRFGGEITLMGIPGGKGSSSVIMPQLQMAMTTSARHPEAAWQFLRGFLSEEYQDGLEWGFPVRVSSLRKLADKAKERPFYLDENGNKVSYDETWWVGGQEVTIPPLSDEEGELVMDFLSGVSRRIYSDSTVSSIITEEAAAYFEGQKSAADVAKIIQSRAQIYVHENR